MKSEPRLTVPFTSSQALRLGLVTLAAPLMLAARAAPTHVEGPPSKETTVTVTASRLVPHVQSTFPAAGAKVTPGLMVLRVTYDTRMRGDGWSYARENGAEYPDCAKAPRLLDDGRSFVLICRTLPGRSYAVWFNRPPLVDFASMGRRAAPPYELKFTTTDDDPIRTLPEAIKADPALSTTSSNPVEPDGLATYGQDVDPPGAP